MSKEQKLAELMVHALVAGMVELVIDRAKSADDVEEGVRDAMKIVGSGLDRLTVTIGEPGAKTDAKPMAKKLMEPIFREIVTQAEAGARLAKSKARAH